MVDVQRSPDPFPEGTVLIEIRGIYDGWSVAEFPDGTLVNRWNPNDRARYAATQEWIERRKSRVTQEPAHEG